MHLISLRQSADSLAKHIAKSASVVSALTESGWQNSLVKSGVSADGVGLVVSGTLTHEH